MALLQHGFLPTNPLSSTSYEKLNNFPPYFKLRTTTARNPGYSGATTANEVIPRTHLSATPETYSSSNLSIGSKGEAEECLSLLNRCNTHVSNAKQIHARAVKSGVLCSNTSIRNKLVILYAKDLGSIDDARKLFDKSFDRSVQAYAALIGSYFRANRWEDLLSTVGMMVHEGMQPDKYLLPSILKACSGLEDLRRGRMIHGYVIRKQLELDVFVGNSFIDMYSKCGDLDSSRTIFDMMPERDVVSWTALISANMDAGLFDVARDVFEAMQLSEVKPDLISWSALVSGFARNGEIDAAIQLLGEMQENGLKPNAGTWNGVISGCVQSGNFEDALDVFRKMLLFEDPDVVTIASILPACAGLGDLISGKLMHTYALKNQMLGHIYVVGSLIDMYSKCGMSDYAWRVFVEIKNKNIIVWNEMIAAYVNEGKMSEAKELLSLMQNDGLVPDIVSYNTVLTGYARMGQKEEAFELVLGMGKIGLKPNIISFDALISGFQQSGLSGEALKLFRNIHSPSNIIKNMSVEQIQPSLVTISSALAACADLKSQSHGKEIHGRILRNGLKPNIYVLSALVDMYSKCRDMNSATRLFYSIEEKNTVAWNTLMDGWRNCNKPKEALKLYPEMLRDGHTPSLVTLMILLSTCSDMASLRLGREVHGCLVKFGFSEFSVTLASALIHMYANCGSMIEAKLVFDSHVQKDVALWNALISGYSVHGMAKDVIALFEELESSSISPDHITFTSLLSAFIRDGLLEEGWKYFNLMEEIYGIKPRLEHYTCMVGIMGSAGLLQEAFDYMRRIPCKPDACMWATLLRSCRVHSNLEIGEKAAKVLFELEPSNASNYILLYNMYATAGMWESVKNVRSVMRGHRLLSVNEWSSIDIAKTIHTFSGGQSLHPELEDILDMWDDLASEMEHDSYFPLDPVLVEDEEQPDIFSCMHTEKLAICFGIMNARQPIRILKSIRMCIDCHSSAKYISKNRGCEIFVKDGCFYHHFKDGICNCQDRW